MKKLIRRFIPVLLLVLLTICFSCASAEYPFKSVTMIVPYGAGGTTDVVGRQFAAALGKTLGTTFVVENQGGASGAIGCQAALDADKDGSVVLFTAESLGTQRVMDISAMSYADFSPILVVANDPKVLVVAGDSPYNTIDELLSDIAAQPYMVQMSYTGPGGSGHVQALIMNQYGYIPALTPYGSGADCYRAVMSGEVVFTNSNYSTVAELIKSGDLKLLAVAATERMAQFPDVPALSEKMENSEALLTIPYTPLSLLVAKDVPQEIQDALRAAALEAVKDPDFTAFMEANSIDKLYEKYTTLDEISAFYGEWESVVSWLIYDAGAAAHSPEEFDIPRVR
ncbi:MAG: tripartite tricarboxylate transporter substrate binding protein [Clostridia bacterium]|nr:tripartite tricarboxylate transporter substrate binding protein [Clostridia bacterium]